MEFIVFVNLFVAVWLAYQAGEAETGSKGRTICLAFSVANALVPETYIGGSTDGKGGEPSSAVDTLLKLITASTATQMNVKDKDSAGTMH